MILVTLLLAALLRLAVWLVRPAFWLLSGVCIVTVLTSSPVSAGWLWGPDPKVEAANHALERAAQIATEAARTQSSQQAQFLAAVEALANERTHLAGHLTQLSEMAKQDSAWASALFSAGPVLVSVAVLSLAGLAIWLTTRAGSHDAELASVLVDELAGTNPALLVSQSFTGHSRSLNYEANRHISPTPEEEMPF
jgi:hypothetical protein